MAVGILTVLVALGHAAAKDFLGAVAPSTHSSTAAPSPLTTFPGIGALASALFNTTAPDIHSSTAAPLSTFPGLGAFSTHDAHRDEFWVVSAGFGWLAGPHSGICRGRSVSTYPNECAFKYIAKTSDGMFIAGLNIESYFKMVRFSAAGVSQLNSGKYLVGRRFPNSAAELLSLYADGIAYDYTFVKGLDWSVADDFWVVSAGFGWLAGPYSGVCRYRSVSTYPNECAFKYIAKTADGMFVAGLNIESFFKMVRFSAEGVSQPRTGKYLMAHRFPNSAAELLGMYAEGIAYDYTFAKGLDYKNLADKFWVVSAGFGWLAGPHSGVCRDRSVFTYPNECAFKYIVKTSDGMFIAGLNIESYFKMVRFSAEGGSQPNSGKYLLGRRFPSSAVELLAMYSGGTAYDYTFVKGLDYKNFEKH